MSPRRLGSAASGPRNGWAVINWLIDDFTSASEANKSPFCLKKASASGRFT